MKPVFSYAGLSRIATVATAFLFSGCGEHVVVLELSNLSSDATAVSAYYKIETDSYRAQSIATTQLLSGKPALGFRAPAGRDGTMNIQVFGYKNQIPCALSKGNTDVNVGGAGKITTQLVLDNGASGGGCLAGDAPVRYPADAKVWAAAANDVWIVGKDAAVLHWNGALFREIALPDSVTGTPRPTWNAVRGDSQGNVWFVGDSDAVVQLDKQGQATRIKYSATPSESVKWTGVYVENGEALLSGTNAGESRGYVGDYARTKTSVDVNPTGATGTIAEKFPVYGLLAMDCTSLANCWFVGEGSTVVQLQNRTTMLKNDVDDEDTCGSPDTTYRIVKVLANTDQTKVKLIRNDSGNNLLDFFDWKTKCFVYQPSNRKLSSFVGLHGKDGSDPIVVETDRMYRWNAMGLVPLPNPPKGVWQSVSAVAGGGFFATAVDGRIYYGTLSP